MSLWKNDRDSSIKKYDYLPRFDGIIEVMGTKDGVKLNIHWLVQSRTQYIRYY